MYKRRLILVLMIKLTKSYLTYVYKGSFRLTDIKEINSSRSSRLLLKNLKIKIHRTIILPVVLYGCETWSLTLTEERRVREFENGVFRRIRGLEF